MMGGGMTGSTLTLLVLAFIVLFIVLSYIAKEIYICLHWKDLKGKVVCMVHGIPPLLLPVVILIQQICMHSGANYRWCQWNW